MDPAARTAHGQHVRQEGHAVATANALEFVHSIVISHSRDRKRHFSVTRKEPSLCREGLSWKTSPRFGYCNLIEVLCASPGKGGGELQLEGSEM